MTVIDTPAAPLVAPETYRGYPVQELRRRCSFEQVAYLLWHGELPTPERLAAQRRAERAQRALPPGIAAAIAARPVDEHPVDALRATVSLLGRSGPAAGDATAANPAAANPAASDHPARADDHPSRASALRLFAVLPSVIAFEQRRRRGLGPIAPRGDLGYAANFLYMTFGKVPEPQVVAAFETSLILYAEHGFNGSAFSARFAAPAFPGAYDAVAAAMTTLKNPLHRGPSEAVLTVLDEIAAPENARPWLAAALATGRTIAGFEHPALETDDSQAAAMRTALGLIAGLRGGQRLLSVHDALAAAMADATGLRPGLEFPTSPAYHLIGFDTAMFGPLFAAARLPAWTARIAGDD